MYHLDPSQGPAGSKRREVSPLPPIAAHLIFRGCFASLIYKPLTAEISRSAFTKP
jgi:hypothetical protein